MRDPHCDLPDLPHGIANDLGSKMRKIKCRRKGRQKDEKGIMVLSAHARQRAKERNISIGHLREDIVAAFVRSNDGRHGAYKGCLCLHSQAPDATIVVTKHNSTYLVVTLFEDRRHAHQAPAHAGYTPRVSAYNQV